MSWNTANAPLFLYGSDGSEVQPMTEGMSTTGARTGFKGPPTPRTPIKPASVGRVNHHTAAGNINNLTDPSCESVVAGGASAPTATATSKPATRFILGDTHTSGAWTATVNISQEFLKDRIPTKVKVVPTLLGYDEVSVAAGSSHPSSTPSPSSALSDYHVLEPPPKDRINATVDLTNSRIGNPIARNFPQSSRLTANMDLEDEGCEIFHAVFRVAPTTLERVYFDASSPTATAWGVDTADNEMPNTVMPRHDSENGGWGLHQLTPFRPIACTSWAQVPLCAAIEAGGSYQRGCFPPVGRRHLRGRTVRLRRRHRRQPL